MGYSNEMCNLCSCNIETFHYVILNVVKYNTYGELALKKVFVPNEQLSLTYTLLVIGYVNSKNIYMINTLLFETKIMIRKCRNYTHKKINRKQHNKQLQ